MNSSPPSHPAEPLAETSFFRSGPTDRKPPFFSIVIPTYARPRQLTSCLQSLVELDYPHDRFEVIVVDDGGAVKLEGVVASMRDDLDVILLTQPHTGPAGARNVGAERARGEFLAFIDDDCKPHAEFLKVLADRFASHPQHAIGGRTLNALPDNLYSRASQLLLDFFYSYYNRNPSQARFFASNNLAVPKDRFLAMGGFDTSFVTAAAEDREFCDRWLTSGHRMSYAPGVVVHHAHPLTFRSFWRQHFSYGRGAFRFHRTRARRGLGRFHLDLKFYLALLRYPFFRLRGLEALSGGTLMLVSQVANTVGVLWEVVKPMRGTALGRLP